MFNYLINGGANSVTLPTTKGNRVTGTVRIPRDHFAAAQSEIAGVIKKYEGTKWCGKRSNAVNAILDK